MVWIWDQMKHYKWDEDRRRRLKGTLKRFISPLSII